MRFLFLFFSLLHPFALLLTERLLARPVDVTLHFERVMRGTAHDLLSFPWGLVTMTSYLFLPVKTRHSCSLKDGCNGHHSDFTVKRTEVQSTAFLCGPTLNQVMELGFWTFKTHVPNPAASLRFAVSPGARMVADVGRLL